MTGGTAAEAASVSDLTRALARYDLAPAQAVASLAQFLAQAHGVSLVGHGLRLFDNEPAPLPADVAAEIPLDAAPDLLGPVFQQLLSGAQRHDSGVHYTPAVLASGLVAAAVSEWDRADDSSLTILDPSVGGGAFLLAAARWREASTTGRERSRRSICAELLGRDIDAEALGVAEAALGLWAIAGDELPAPLPGLCVGDVLAEDLPAADLIVGNPPFLNQLGTGTARTQQMRNRAQDRFAVPLGPYADSAAAFLLAGFEALAPGGRMMLIQPASFLASRDVAAVRRHLATAGCLVGLWFTDDMLFDASVLVCAPVVELRLATGSGLSPQPMRRWTGETVGEIAPVVAPIERSWGPAVADLIGLPVPTMVRAKSKPRVVGDLATATAGFRDQFYGYVPFTAEESESPTGAKRVPLVTTGMIDPLRNRWGTGTFRFAKTTWGRPVVDLDALELSDPRLFAWSTDRLRPKVVVATQTRVIEAAVDAGGEWIPVTPLLSVEPLDADDVDVLWRLAAVLSAPPVSAVVLGEQLGTALAVQAIKMAARHVTELPLPADGGAWTEGAAAARQASEAITADEWSRSMEQLGHAMTRAYGSELDVFEWWRARLPVAGR